MKYWKIVDVGDYRSYTSKILNLFTTQNKLYFNRTPSNFWNPVKSDKLEQFIEIVFELELLINIFGKIRELSVLVLTNDDSSLHIDHTTGLNKDVKARLNIPMLNCEGSTTAFFQMNDRIFDMHNVTENGTKTWIRQIRDRLKPVTQVDLLQPTILRTSSPHTVICHSCKFPRISLSVSFEKDLVHILDQD